MKKILCIFSYVFHPLFIPLFGTLFYIIFNGSHLDNHSQFLLLLQVSIATIFLPISFFLLLRTYNRVNSIMIYDIGQRKAPLLIQIGLIFLLVCKTLTVDLIPELNFFFLGGLLSAIMAFGLLFLNIKASLHMLSISAVTAFVIGLSLHNQINMLNIIIPLIMINGLVASSRLEMEAHSIKELSIGFWIGLSPQLLFWICWL